ncbi:DUF3106 domain-containing protein [Limnohabitans sp.]|uniref:DUF3106 domain-containing protein n=1 Tax=Limnohabitans sp. TaxID=1907725 RepID=UPI00286F4DEC|nr:DUF3106 domain-containing protein [Limnohabitans sp.]
MLLQRSITATFIAQLLLSGAVLFTGVMVGAQTAPVVATKPAPSLPGRPLWMDLAESQQQALAPLAQLWPTMTEPHKRKWLAVSQNFGQLSADEQATVQGRMREWAALSPQQRTAARLNYADAKQLLQEDKKAKWEAYQALSPEAKQKLAAQQSQPIQGAAPATKPVSAAKLTSSPAASTNKPLPRIATDQVAPTTLLPTPVTSTAPASAESALAPQ